MSFLNPVEIEMALRGLSLTYPGLCQLITLPFDTVEHFESHAVLIGTGTACPAAAVLIVSGMHARERGGPDICINLAADLLEAYTLGSGLVYGGTSYTAGEVRKIIERVDLIIFPDVNPDGRQFQAAGSDDLHVMWRKNRNPESSGTDPKTVGVDVNRNFDFLWDFKTAFAPAVEAGGTLASTSPSSDLFHGKAAFSEQESKNVRWLFERYPHISWFMDIHSYGGDILHAWGDDSNQMSNQSMNFLNPAWNGKRGLEGDQYGEYIGACYLAKTKSVANAMKAAIAGVHGVNYEVDQSFFLPSWYTVYPTSGTSDDWATSLHFVTPSRKKIYSYCIEFNKVKTFFPTWEQMEPIILDIDAALVRLCLEAAPKLVLPTWWCRVKEWLTEAIWHKVFPPELWGPYGPWERIRQVFEPIFIPIIRPFLRRSQNR